MRSFLFAFSLLVLGASSIHAQPFVADWTENIPQLDGTSCVATCARSGGWAVISGVMNVAVTGDPSLYICRAAVPTMPVYGERAGYNWNGRIGGNVQPGCTVVGGRGGYSHARNFSCLCSSELDIRE